jgi:hypothetical protein
MVLLEFAANAAISSPDYSQKFARKKRITSRSNSGSGRREAVHDGMIVLEVKK